MKKYDIIAIGSGSSMNIVEPMIEQDPNIRIAVIDKDEPGGICLTRGCIPSKIILYPAELVRTIEKAQEFGINADIKKISFQKVMHRMRRLVDKDIRMIRRGLSESTNIDYYPHTAEFIAPYTLKVNGIEITASLILLCTGSKITIPPIKGLDKVRYHTSDSALRMTSLPRRLAIVGGGYIAAELGHFFSSMGSNVTILGRNPQFLPDEEPEVSALMKRELSNHMTILTNCVVIQVSETKTGNKKIMAKERESGKERVILADELMIAVGRGSTSNILHPERAGIDTDGDGWIKVDKFLETSQPNIWAFGDATGSYLFKHVANYESQIVYYNAILKEKIEVDYRTIPHAVFCYPEIGSVGLREKEAIEKHGEDNILIGFQKYEDTAKGEAMASRDYFTKVIVELNSRKILGAHIVGPYASLLIQEIINAMNMADGDYSMITNSMHIHPALSEVVERAFLSKMSPQDYHSMIGAAH
ncbi:MAG: dihydrolipoyl dehydrogenase [Nitrososphaerales archaeon]